MGINGEPPPGRSSWDVTAHRITGQCPVLLLLLLVHDRIVRGRHGVGWTLLLPVSSLISLSAAAILSGGYFFWLAFSLHLTARTGS